MLCDDCEGEILATEEDNASLKEVKVYLTWDNIVCNILCNYCKADDAGKPSDWLVEGGELGFANSHSRLGHTPAPPPLPGLPQSHLPPANPNMECRFCCWLDQSGAGAAAGGADSSIK